MYSKNSSVTLNSLSSSVRRFGQFFSLKRFSETNISSVIIFIFAFAVPVLTVWLLRSQPTTPSVYLNALEQHSRKIEPNGSRLTFFGSGPLNPPADKDFIVFSIWKLRTLPAPGERTVLMSKTRAGTRTGNDRSADDGFALGIINDFGSLRFMLAWPSPEGARWMRFGEVSVKPDQWFLIALSVRKKQRVGAFFVPLDGVKEKPNVQTLGGFTAHEFSEDSSEPLSLAPQGSGRFMSRVGPSGIFRGSELGGREIEIFREFAKNPTVPPDSLNRNQIVLFWSGGKLAIGHDDETQFQVN